MVTITVPVMQWWQRPKPDDWFSTFALIEVGFCGCNSESVFTPMPPVILVTSAKVVDFDGSVVNSWSFTVVGSVIIGKDDIFWTMIIVLSIESTYLNSPATWHGLQELLSAGPVHERYWPLLQHTLSPSFMADVVFTWSGASRLASSHSATKHLYMTAWIQRKPHCNCHLLCIWTKIQLLQ